ncbi:MAG: TetR/AcrR family transcriptional regulator [Pirellulaceae bacterium]|nr:TetR/AcrR family transcriptional regulator [Pirellulaceae bacterium]
MSTISRKKQQIDQREQQILQLARGTLLSEGLGGLSMERLAAEMQFAKGTLYNHFPNKEEIVVALALESLELRRKLFETAAISRPRSRERMAAIGCACDLYASHFRQHFAIEEMLRSGAILEKSSEIRQKLVQQFEQRIMAIVAGVVRDAVAMGDLQLPKELSAEEFVFGFWALMYGSQILMATSPALVDIGVNQPQRSIRYHGWTLMNGYNWQPLVSYEQTDQLMNSLRERLLKHDH